MVSFLYVDLYNVGMTGITHKTEFLLHTEFGFKDIVFLLLFSCKDELLLFHFLSSLKYSGISPALSFLTDYLSSLRYL